MAHGRREGNVQRLGFSQRFLKFLMNNLFGRDVKRVTLGRESVEVPIEAPTRNGSNSVLKASSRLNGEIVVEFRHVEPSSKKNGNLAVTPTTDARFGGNHKGSVEGNRRAGRNNIEKDIVIIHQPTINSNEPAGEDRDINKMAEDFIRSRKGDMNKRY